MIAASHTAMLLVVFLADTHTYNWANPTGQEQGTYKRQRALAMDYAAKFMRPRK
jgi:hypothetical protein